MKVKALASKFAATSPVKMIEAGKVYTVEDDLSPADYGYFLVRGYVEPADAELTPDPAKKVTKKRGRGKGK
jgi:hypothetical protein